MRKITISFLLVTLVACKERNVDTNKEVSPSSVYLKKYKNIALKDSLRDRILLKGDVKAYEEARDIYFFTDHNFEFFYYALIMSSEYDHKEANEDITFINRWLKDSINPETKKYLNSLK